MLIHQTFLWNDVSFFQLGGYRRSVPLGREHCVFLFKMFGLCQITKRSYGTMLAFTNLTATDEPSLWDVDTWSFLV